jgi:hypothetical protein
MNPRGAYQKKSANVRNVEARLAWCLARLSDAVPLSEDGTRALESQRSFAALRVPDCGVHPIALNTLKTIADEVLAPRAPDNRGFLYLDGLRCALKKRVGKQPEEAKAGGPQRQALQQLRKQLRLTEARNLERTRAYVDLFSKLVAFTKAVSVDDGLRLKLNNLLQDHKDLYAPLLCGTGTTEPALRVISGGKP